MSRKIPQQQLARIQFLNLTVFTDHVEQLVERFSKLEVVADLQPFFFSCTLNTTTALLFGESAESLDENSDDKFSASWDLASWISAVRVKLLDFYWVYKPRRYTIACDEVVKYAENYIQKALAADEADTGRPCRSPGSGKELRSAHQHATRRQRHYNVSAVLNLVSVPRASDYAMYESWC